VTNQRASDPYCRFVESAAASIACDWPVLQTTIRSTAWVAVMQGGKRMVCLPQNGLPSFHRLPSNQSANLRSELLPSPSKYACAGSTDDASNGRTATVVRYGVFTPYRFQVLSLLFSGSQPAFKEGAESLLSAHSLMGLGQQRADGLPHECYKKETIGSGSKWVRLEHSDILRRLNTCRWSAGGNDAPGNPRTNWKQHATAQ
jgi:hypothetical protein